MNLLEVAPELGRRLTRDVPARRATGAGRCYGGIEKFQSDPHWRDLLLFHEYFHGDNGAGLGASHQTGWTGTVALLFLLPARARAVRRDRRRRRLTLVMRLPRRPTIYEINTAVWLQRLGRERGRPLALDEVPGAEWDALAALPVDAVWLMGVWERSPAGLRDRAGRPGAGRRPTAPPCPTCATEDVIGSPYCVRDYVVDERFGGPAALAAARGAARRARAWADPRLRAQPRRARPSVDDRAPRVPASPAPRRTSTRDPEAFLRTARRRSSPAGATRTSRRGPTSCSSTPSRRRCARPWPRR